MRFRATALAPGWLKVTLAAVPMLKLCQSMAVRALLCCTVSALLVWLMVATPALTCPPVGRAFWSSAQVIGVKVLPSTATNAAVAACPALPPTVTDLPRPRAVSAVATHVCDSTLQTRR